MTPLWPAIARTLCEDIAQGRSVPGDTLPSQAQLVARFGVNRHTVRHALSVLVWDGLERTRRGAGALVAAKLTEYLLGKTGAVSREPDARRAPARTARVVA